jgi:hypothetical protein
MGRVCSTDLENRNVCSVLVGKPEGKRPLGRPRFRTDRREIGWGGMDWTGGVLL